MIIIILILALAIMLLANTVLGAAEVYSEKTKKDNEDGGTKPGIPAAILAGLLLAASLLSGLPVSAKEQSPAATSVAPEAAGAVNGISDTAFYLITGVVFTELLVIVVLLYNLKLLLDIRRKKKTAATGLAAANPEAARAKLRSRLSWWDKFNRFKPVDKEIDLDLGHDYDGIRELDNSLPPWWIYGFYITILFGCVYLWRYHVSHTAPSSAEEFQIAMKAADVEKAEYLKNSANNIDETTVKLLTGEADLAAGKTVFQTTCFACHGKNGEGIVGPNLTDDYWLHGGSIQSIFKTIKYGYPEKGMKSWKDDYSPIQIAQIASYVKSLKGTNPPNPKAPQGNLEADGAKQEAAGKDSGLVKNADTTKLSKP